jgi:hypothetical protein
MRSIAKIARKITNSAGFRMRRRMDGLKQAFRVSFPQGAATKFSHVEQFLPEEDSEYELYQKYFENSLRESVRVTQTKSLNGFAPHTTHVGQYIFHLRSGGIRRVAIDAHDHRNIRSQAIYDWCDVYFKSNRWPGIDYGPKVQPIPIGNAGITLENCRYLRGLRGAKKELDLIFVGRIWAGGDANVEHNLRLFESLAKVKCKSKLLAVVFNFDKQSEEFQIIARRLNESGVEMTDGQIGYGDLMKMSAASKLVVLRAGISGCIAWRMVDMLGLGACLVLDCSPFPEWPQPLREEENFLNLGLRITPECGPAPDEDYDSIVSKVNSFLTNDGMLQRIGENNSRYFDKHSHPMRVADYILETVNKYSDSCNPWLKT